LIANSYDFMAAEKLTHQRSGSTEETQAAAEQMEQDSPGYGASDTQRSVRIGRATDFGYTQVA
jgi:hypothetical protein